MKDPQLQAIIQSRTTRGAGTTSRMIQYLLTLAKAGRRIVFVVNTDKERLHVFRESALIHPDGVVKHKDFSINFEKTGGYLLFRCLGNDPQASIAGTDHQVVFDHDAPDHNHHRNSRAWERWAQRQEAHQRW